MRASSKRFLYILILVLSFITVAVTPLFATESTQLRNDLLLLKTNALGLARDIKTIENQVLEAKGESLISVFFSIKQIELSTSSTLLVQLDNQVAYHRNYNKDDLNNLSVSGGHLLFEIHIKPGEHVLQASIQNKQISHHFSQTENSKVLHIVLDRGRGKSLEFDIKEW